MIWNYDRAAIIAGDRQVSFTELLQRTQVFAEAANLSRGAKTVIFCENREGWVYALFATWLSGGIAVPVDAMSTADDVAFILGDCQPTAVWTSKKRADVMEKAVKQAKVDTQVRLVDTFERTPLTSLNTPEEGKPGLDRLFTDDEEKTALIVYTSGTTGRPKGVMLSFRNMFANVRAVSEEVPIYRETTRALILLPLHHVLPLMGTLIAPMMLGAGVTICPSMTGPDIMQTLQTGDVHIIVGVPRLWQTIYQGVMKKIDASAVARFLFWLCGKANSPKLSRTVFSAVHKKLGGRLEFCVNGGAAIPKEVAQGMKTLGLDLLDGYGMTEMAPMISFTRPGELVPGSVGKAMPSVQVKFVDGELCAKGPNLMQGYYRREEETAEVIDAEGFIRTGDLGHTDAEGHIFLTGRKKEIIVLSNGKNIDPTEIEYGLEQHGGQAVKEVGVTQDGDKLCAIIVPDELWARQRSDEQQESELKRLVVEPYNQATESYKRVLEVFVYHGDLPRTRMEKLQRYKLPALLQTGQHTAQRQQDYVEPTFEEYRLVKQYIEEEKRVAVRPTDSLDTDLALDSLDKVGLQSFIELTFGLKLTSEKLAAFRTVQQLAEYVSDYKTRIEVEKTDWTAILREDSSHIQLPKTWWTAGVIVGLAKWLARMYFGLEGKGMENIPAKGPFVIAPNHQSYFDGMFVTAFMPKRLVLNSYFYAKQDHVRNWFAKMMARHNNVVVVDLNNLKESIQTLGEALKRGKNVIVFPEGTRTRTGKLGPFKKMFAILCRELNVPIVPVVIKGAYEAMPKGQHYPSRAKVTVEYLPAVSPEGMTYGELSEEVRGKIAERLK